MTELQISYPILVAVVGAAQPEVFYVPVGSGYQVFCSGAAYFYKCVVTSPVDVSAFEADIKPAATSVAYEDDARALISIENRTVLKSPVTPDGRIIQATNGYPQGTVLQVSGRADSRTLGRNKGQALYLANKAPGDYEIEWGYNDSVWLTGGGSFIHGSDDANDHFTLDSYCPATPVVPNGGNTGNCNVVNGLIIPAAGDGAFDVDLATVNPLPAPGGAGFWDWNQAITGLGTVTPSAPGEGNSLLLAVDYTLNVFAPEVHFVGSTQAPFVFPDVVASHLWPFWKVRLKLHVESAEVDFACHLILARYETT